MGQVDEPTKTICEHRLNSAKNSSTKTNSRWRG